MVQSQGVTYLLSHAPYMELLAVSLYTLRKHWQGPVAVFCCNDGAELAANRLTDANIQVIRWDNPIYKIRHGSYIAKPFIDQLSPFARTACLDADTIIAGPIDELFAAPFTVTHFAGWNTQGKIIKGRLQQWNDLDADTNRLVERSLAYPWPAVNGGVVGFEPTHPLLKRWEDLCIRGKNRSLTDEVALQLLVPEYSDVATLDGRFNWSCRFGREPVEEARIIHLHGRAHVRKKEGELWWPVFREAIAAKWCGIDEWAGEYDEGVRSRMPQRIP